MCGVVADMQDLLRHSVPWDPSNPQPAPVGDAWWAAEQMNAGRTVVVTSYNYSSFVGLQYRLQIVPVLQNLQTAPPYTPGSLTATNKSEIQMSADEGATWSQAGWDETSVWANDFGILHHIVFDVV